MKRSPLIAVCLVATTALSAGIVLFWQGHSSSGPALPVGAELPAALEHPETILHADHSASDLPTTSPEMAAALRQLNEEAERARVEIPLEGGGVELRNGYHSTTAAVIGADGKVHIRHGEDFLTPEQPVD